MRLRPCRRAVDCAAMRSDWNHFRQLAPRRKVAGDIGIVGLWKCGIMRLWDYGIGSRRFQFHNSVSVHFHNCTISQFMSDAGMGPRRQRCFGGERGAIWQDGVKGEKGDGGRYANAR